jgi:hypothetical protein
LDRVELPVSFRKAYPRQNRIYVTNYLWYHERYLLLLTLPQFHEFSTGLRAGQDRDAELLRLFFIGGAEEVQISNDKLPIAEHLLDYLGAFRCRPYTATLCWLPPAQAATKYLSRKKTARRRILVPA